VPRAAAAGMLGMREGGRRRVLVPPALGWTDDSIGPPRPDFTATRRLATHGREPLLFEAELVRVRAACAYYCSQRSGCFAWGSRSGKGGAGGGAGSGLNEPTRTPLPQPRSPKPGAAPAAGSGR
jgi:hypothetical protein